MLRIKRVCRVCIVGKPSKIKEEKDMQDKKGLRYIGRERTQKERDET